jgi:hypothetical protein
MLAADRDMIGVSAHMARTQLRCRRLGRSGGIIPADAMTRRALLDTR